MVHFQNLFKSLQEMMVKVRTQSMSWKRRRGNPGKGCCKCCFLLNYESVNMLQPLCLACQKYARKHKGAVKMCMTVLKMHITCKQKCEHIVVHRMHLISFQKSK